MDVSEIENFIHLEDGGTSRALAGGDFDGDGRPDVLNILPDGRLVLYRGNGAAGWINGLGQVIGSGWNGFSQVVFPGDFNHDGFGDLIGFLPDGRALLYSWKGTGWG